MKKDAPNDGHYKVVRASSVSDGELNPIKRVVFTKNVDLER